MGYGLHQKRYRCYHPPSRRMYTTMDVTFSESEMYYFSAFSNPSLQGKTLHDEQVWTMATTIDLPLPLLAQPVAMAALGMATDQFGDRNAISNPITTKINHIHNRKLTIGSIHNHTYQITDSPSVNGYIHLC